jgi:3-oxoadipate enol-lactonase
MPYIFLEDNLKVYYEVHGNDESYPIVLIHPLGGNIMIWEEEISLILKSGKYKILAYELRGHHRSNMGNKPTFTMEDLANDLYKLLKKLQISKCTLLGHSIGGKIAAVFAKNHINMLDAIIFISGSSIPIHEDDLEDSAAIEIALKNGMAAVADYERKKSFSKEEAFQSERNWNRFKQIFSKTSVEGFIASRNALRTMPKNINHYLKNSNCKLFGIVGSKDEVFLNLKKIMKQEIPQFKLKVIDGEGHWLILHNPVELDKAIEESLGEINEVS